MNGPFKQIRKELRVHHNSDLLLQIAKIQLGIRRFKFLTMTPILNRFEVSVNSNVIYKVLSFEHSASVQFKLKNSIRREYDTCLAFILNLIYRKAGF